MSYIIPQNIEAKLLRRIQQDQYEMKNFTTRSGDLTLNEEACGINPTMLEKNPELFHPDSLGVEMAKDGYALFTNTDTFDREAKYILAIPFDKVVKT